MEKAKINGADIAYEVDGDGEPVLLIHGAFVADALRPLANHPALSGMQRIVYHRRGYGDSSGEAGTDVAGHAKDALALLDHLGVESAHVLGHSYGGSVAVQLACDAPSRVRSLSLLEPATMAIPNAATLGEVMPRIMTPFMEGNADESLDRFFRAIAGPDYRAGIEAGVGKHAWVQVQADADDAFAGDLTTLGEWALSADQTATITCPTLFVLGADSGIPNREVFAEFGATNPNVDMFREMVGVFQTLLPQGTLVELPGLNHALQMIDADAVANAVAPFLAKQKAAVAT
jgi:pimeloyl-ACP methyl ester carboxylesterase